MAAPSPVEPLLPDLSEDQVDARRRIREALTRGERELVFTGPAGSGKTTLLRVLIADVKAEGWKVRSLALTGKAAVNLHQVTGEEAGTVHGALYRQVQDGEDGRPRFFGRQAPCEEKTLVLVDEASMMDTHLHHDFMVAMPKGSVVLFIGDREQLPPVRGTWGCDFANPTAALTQIHRQALGNPILAISALVREGGKLPQGVVGEAYLRRRGSLEEVVEAAAMRRRVGADVAILTQTNEIRERLNRFMRRALGHADQGALTAGDRVLVRRNNKIVGRMNGEVLTVERVVPWLETREGQRAADDDQVTALEAKALWVRTVEGARFYTAPDLIGAEGNVHWKTVHGQCRGTWESLWLNLDYGEALTVHAGQGSGFDEVFFVIDGMTRYLAGLNPVQARRLVYTAVTRAKKRLEVWDLG